MVKQRLTSDHQPPSPPFPTRQSKITCRDGGKDILDEDSPPEDLTFEEDDLPEDIEDLLEELEEEIIDVVETSPDEVKEILRKAVNAVKDAGGSAWLKQQASD